MEIINADLLGNADQLSFCTIKRQGVAADTKLTHLPEFY